MKSIGKLTYSPYSHLGKNDKWVVLMCDDEISRYYRHLYAKEYPYLNSGRSTKLTRPVWGAHVSVIRNEKVADPKLWRTDEGKLIDFEYEGGVLDNKEYFYLRVYCPYLGYLREHLGLPREPKFGLHLTVGRTTQ